MPESALYLMSYSIVLFAGYIWIKFRVVAPKRAVHARRRKDGGLNHEPRFKPPREKDVVTGAVLTFGCVPLGGYDTCQDAKIVCQIAGFYYGRDVGTVDVEDGFQFFIPEMSERERGLRGKEKRKWVSLKAKEVYKELKEDLAARRQQPMLSNTLSSVIVGEAQMDAGDFPSPADHGAEISTNNSDDEFLNFLSEILLNEDDVQEGFEGQPTMRDQSLNEQLNLQKEQLEAEFNRRIAEQHQQHLQIQQGLEEQIFELRRENEHTKSILHEVMKPILGLSAFLPLDTEI